MKYIIAAFMFLSFCTGLFCYGITIGKKMQIAEYQDAMTKYQAETLATVNKANDEINKAKQQITTKYRDRVVIKEVSRIQAESCVTGQTIADVMNHNFKESL